MKFWSRLLIAFCGLMTLALSAVVFAYGAGFFPFHLNLSALDIPLAAWQRVVIVLVAMLMAAIGVFAVSALFRRAKDKGFIIQHTEFGDMSISMRALENMVRKCVESHDELTPGTTKIFRNRDGIVVSIKVTLSGNANIPLTVNALQKQIKQYITSSSGVDVREVRVMVETNQSKLEAPQKVEAVPAETAAAEHEPVKEVPHVHSIFHHREEPTRYAEKPAQEETVMEPLTSADIDDVTEAQEIVAEAVPEQDEHSAEALEASTDNEHTEADE